ncbi:hypothetical protein P43SY_008289 [Pythium insidiosum]|uniref:1,3-beta-glucan synthase n=1 Tax=Pythium insidiosum TaxID=114742 RepID=A0AAD5LRE8_PYTIN|nr:hypothetical protein P43SY_008289 [Pythium insidiosum]
MARRVLQGSGSSSSMSGIMSEALEMQRQMCDEAMSLVKQGMAMQNASPPNVAGAEASLSRAVDIMEQALSIRYSSAEEKDAAERLNSKMERYVKMIKSQRAKNQGGAPAKRAMQKHNILEMDNLAEFYTPIMHMLHNSPSLGDVFDSLKRTFGFQEGNVMNQKEHLMLILTNMKEQADEFEDKKKKKNKKKTGEEYLEEYMRPRDPQRELEDATKGLKRLHTRLFANYVKWCKYVSQKPKFTNEQIVDVALFFLLWGEAANFRQMPECLCFLLHNMLPQAMSRDDKEPGFFLANTIRPMYAEFKRDNDKKTSKGARAAHTEIRNYDDFNEFFWTKKCLKFDIKTIGEAFGNYDKKGRPKVVKKTFNEKRTWFRAILSFRRIFFFNFALFLATLGFSINMVLLCPDSPIMYGQDVQPLKDVQAGRVFEVMGKKYSKVAPADEDLQYEEDAEETECNEAKLATCLGVPLVETSLFIWSANPDDYLQYSNFMIQFSFHNITYLFFLWVPAFMVFLYDAQIFYAILSVVVGSFAGFNLRIGELRSFRILRLTFKSIPGVFNKKIVPNIYEDPKKAKKKKSKAKKGDKEDLPMPERRFERISMSQGNKPLTVKAQKYSSLLEARDDDVYNELRTPNGNDEEVASQASRASNIGSITGVSGAEFERTIPFAMAWNRCLTSLREADVISDRELNVLSYLIDSKDTVGRKLYPPAFLTAGKLDESIDIVLECYALYEKLKTDKKKKDKTLQKIETTMRERLLKDDLRVESILGSYKFSSQVVRILLGEEHKELDECFNFIEEMASHQQILKGLNLSNLYQCRAACAELMKAILEVPKKSTESSIKFQRALYKVIDALLTVDNFDAEPRSDEGRRRLRFFANSLFMDMPEAKPIRKIRSLTISTPYYNEIVMYSIKDLTTQNDDCIKLLYYLQTIYPFEWENLLERLQAKDMNEALKKNPEEVQLWASYRGQTLARTVRGMMYNEDAIRFLHWLEIGENEPMHQSSCQCNKCVRLRDMVALKFNYVCTCQIYGKQKDEQRPQAQDIDFLLKKHPSLRVAYVDGPKKVKDGPPKYFSVLIRSMEDKIVEVYRVELPGDPIVGEVAYKVYFENRDKIIDKTKDMITTFILAGAIVVVLVLMFCCGYVASRVTKKMSLKQKQRKLRKMKFSIACVCMCLALLSLTVLTLVNVFEVAVLLGVAVYWFMQKPDHHITNRVKSNVSDKPGYDKLALMGKKMQEKFAEM